MDQNQRQFLADTEDLIEQILADLDELRRPAKQARVQTDLLDGIFRSVHRVKGSAGSFGLSGLSEIAHEFEGLLGAARAGQTPLNETVLQTCDLAAIALLESLHSASTGDVESTHLPLLERLRTFAQDSDRAPDLDLETTLKIVPFEIWQSLSGEEKQRLAQGIAKGATLCVVETNFDTTQFDNYFNQLKAKLSQHGEVVTSSPIVDPNCVDKINFRVLFASKSVPEDLTADLAEFPGVAVTKVALLEQPTLSAEQGFAFDQFRTTSGPSLSNFVRLDTDELDRLISSTHELFRKTIRALDLASSQTTDGQGGREEFGQLDAHIRKSFLRVESDLIGLRLISIGPILQRAARAGRAVGRLSNKEVDIEISGEGLRLDKIFCDAIADPLIHLVRNAVDHGIEPASQSGDLAGAKRGLVRIEAYTDGGQTCVRVTDNGRGVDPELVTRSAIRLGIIEKGSACDLERSLRLIFRPGFTTLTSASTISGRGVGLDLVETAVEQLGGELRVSSVVGKGSTFEIRLPSIFGLLTATVVMSASNYYCIDSDKVTGIKAIDSNQIEKSEAGEALRIEGQIVPLVRLRELLGQEVVHGSNDQLPIITCEFTQPTLGDATNGSMRIGIVVDSIHGSEEMLVRSLGRYAGRWSGIAGASELRNGSVALVLDLPALLSHLT